MSQEHSKTKEILKWFEEISKIPRCSKNEQMIGDWIINWAKERDFATKRDHVGNVLVKVPGSSGLENAPIVVLQGHMDMVCEKTKDSNHDFSKDSIKMVFEGEWLTADQTTLGADNGIAIAMAMTLAEDKETKHPPLELLFTVDEETGLTGASALEPGFIDGKILLNIDSEDEGVFTVGCAGGINTNLTFPLDFENLPSGYVACQLTAGGMKGGHSGIDIGMGKANAIKVLGRTLMELTGKMDVRVVDISGGSAHNAIPRDAEALVIVPSDKVKEAIQVVSDFDKIVGIEFKTIEPDMKIELEESGECAGNRALTTSATAKLAGIIAVVPHGVAAMSADIKDLVETSNNLANISLEGDNIKMLTSQRSSVLSRLSELTKRIETVAELSGGKADSGDGYPPWQPNMESPLLKKSIDTYKQLFQREPVVEIIHAGLECGIIGDKYPGMDMISFGPTLKFPHSPDEKIHVETIGMIWDFMAGLLQNLS